MGETRLCISASAAWRKNTQPDKPYEDHLAFDERSGLFCVSDGVTRSRDGSGQYPSDSRAVIAARIVTEEAVRPSSNGDLASSTQAAIAIVANAFGAANRRIATYAATLPEPDFIRNDLPGAVATILYVNAPKLVYGHIGDTALFQIASNKKIRRLTTDQTVGLESWVRRNMQIDDQQRILAVRKLFRNTSGLPQCYGVLTGQPEALDWVEYGTAEVCSGDRLLLLTDGLVPLFDEYRNKPQIRNHIFELLCHEKLDEILVAAEDLDRTRKPTSDDKTLISISFW